ncbi:MAG: 50S ribosomal protein L11 [Dehalococcoidia bacterium]|nr:50S ribosomal protein L11 [Dehalococcoidia bacterium]|tara:strand:- start:686 stop:1114 length:429 start_codon:yes stop_codon:yes gene_type:complete
MAKQVQALVKLQIEAGKATPAPPVGPALGQHGANIMGFVKEYNDRTSKMSGNIIPVEITIYTDKSFTFELKSPPASALIKKMAKLDKGSGESGVEMVGKITRSQAKEIAKEKLQDLNAVDLDAATKIIEGTARSMGVLVEDK